MSNSGGRVEGAEDRREATDEAVGSGEGKRESSRDDRSEASPPGWFDLRDGVGPEVAAVARRLAALAERPEGADCSGEIDSLARDYPTDVLIRAVTVVRACLAEAEGNGLSADRPAGVRRELDRLAEDLWASDLRRERENCRNVLREISHDIRSPLNSILFLADGLYGGRSGSLTDAQHRQLGVVYSAAASLRNMVNDLLDYARTSDDEFGTIASVPFSVSGVLGDVRRLVGPIAEHRDCRFRTEVEIQEPRYGDPRILSRLLVNLVSNAVDAAGKEGEVVVRVTGDDEKLRLRVMDDGDGVDPTRLQRLAGPQSDVSFTGSLSGETHGLGLVICGRMVRAAGGTLEVDRTDEGWTRFTVDLPFGRK